MSGSRSVHVGRLMASALYKLNEKAIPASVINDPFLIVSAKDPDEAVQSANSRPAEHSCEHQQLKGAHIELKYSTPKENNIAHRKK